MRPIAALTVLGLIAGLTSCGSAADDSGSTANTSLDDMAFVSTDVEKDGEPFDLAPGTVISLSFSSQRVSANAGCNTMSGGYQVRGDKLVADDQLATTEMACDEERMDQDQWFTDFLTENPGLSQSGDTLTLTTSETTIHFTDEKVANPDVPLMETKWQLDGLTSNEAVSSVPSGVTADLVFGKDGQIQGHFGCNSGGGDYDVQGHVITFGPIASTLMACARDGSEVEASVLQVLDRKR